MSEHDQIARRYVRTEIGIDMEGSVDTGERKGRATIENISPGGARLTTRVPVEPGQAIRVTMGDMGTADAHVAWTNRYTVGIKFDQEIDAIADLLLAVAIY